VLLIKAASCAEEAIVAAGVVGLGGVLHGAGSRLMIVQMWF
jgi:hypothetical protein